MTEHEILTEMRNVLSEIRAAGPWLEGSLLENKKNKYTKKDGTVSVYPAPPVLQYRDGSGGRGSKRIPAGRVQEIKALLAAGRRARPLLERYAALAAELALSPAEKKTARGCLPSR
jgi:hypothetical protein